ncbi:MAG: helix-turn-helix transcriptional regulator [Ectothiorhodospiraceae bacterium]|nr:helix-turn-helix transcriptional regulator [Chromatiales bacterium]MCP5157535.1 helix-turn-helix transcriptional regulator [Ectothiorhodospiraceae bacterium]
MSAEPETLGTLVMIARSNNHSDDNPDLDTLGGRLRARRKELGWTQMYLAERVGTSQAVIQKIENGKSLRPRILEQIAQSLGVRPAWLQFGVEEVGELSEDAIELARAWSKLEEPHRSATKEAILKIGASVEPTRYGTNG